MSFAIHFQLTSFRLKARPRNCYQVLRLGADTARTISPARLTSGATYQLKDALLFHQEPGGASNRRAPSVQRAPVRSGLGEPSLEPSYQVSFDSCGIPVLHGKGQDMGTLVVDPAKDHALIEELAGPAASLFERHLAGIQAVVPLRGRPWDNAADFAEEAWNAQQYPLSTGVQSAIMVSGTPRTTSPTTPTPSCRPSRPTIPCVSGACVGRRKNGVIRPPSGTRLSRRVPSTPTGSRTTALSTNVKGEVPQSASVAEMISYVSFQELAAQVAHRNTGMALDKTNRGKKIMSSRVGGTKGFTMPFTGTSSSRDQRSTPRRW